MKAMIVSDFAVLRSALLQLVGICVVIALFMGYAMGTLVGRRCRHCRHGPPFMLSVLAWPPTDELNGWERFRLTLPLTRRQVVFGRYARHRAHRRSHHRFLPGAVVCCCWASSPVCRPAYCPKG